MRMDIGIKRAYAPPAGSDGARILVDRLWPRGVKKTTLALDAWCKDIAPSPALRIWFDHRADRFEAFSGRYRKELDHNPVAVADMETWLQRGHVTLIYAARDPAINHAVVLRDWLLEH